jgi:pimeloyl-ACP methyl ester carboxylesterase
MIRCLDRSLALMTVVALGLVLASPSAHAGADPEAVCAEKKAKATGKKANDFLKAYGKDAKKPDGSKLAAGLSKAESKFQKAFGKAEEGGACAVPGDATNIELTVDDFVRDVLCGGAVNQEDVVIPSGAEPAETPGTPGVDNNDYPNLVTQFGGAGFSLNNASYTRYFCGDGTAAPDAVLILVPGFEGGASSFKMLAENSVPRALARGINLEVWAFDRRGHQIEDRAGIEIARDATNALVALDWYYGAELGLALHPDLVAGPNRRAIFHDNHADTAFIANWTELVFSRDIDAVVEAARAVAVNQNVFLGGHSAGTGFTARYASTDLNLTGVGSPDPGYGKLRGLVLLEGGGGSTAGDPPTEGELDQIEDRADGGLFAAVRDDAPRCADGTACVDDSECAGVGQGTCTQPTSAYALVPGILNPRILAAGEVTAVQGLTDPDGGENIIGVPQGGNRCVAGSNPGTGCVDDSECLGGGTCEENTAIAQVPDLGTLVVLGDTTADGGLGSFVDDDGFVSSLATFVRTSVGGPGPVVGGLVTWLDITEGPLPDGLFVDNGPAPTTLPASVWGVEAEVTRMSRLRSTFIAGKTNFTDWYYASSGLGTTSGLPGLDSSALSLDPPAGRGRRDIENLTQAANIDIPVICFGGSNGLTPVPASYLAFADSIGACAAPSCSGSTPRVVDATMPSEAFPTFGDVDGGYEVHISEGYAHVDVVTAEDGTHNRVIGPLVDFVARNLQ